jgi:hypothetical protein
LISVNLEGEAKYAALGVELYQRKGQDFSEEICSHFIQACIRSKGTHLAGKIFLDKRNRISAWASPKMLANILTHLEEDHQTALEVTLAMAKKGLVLNEEVFSRVLKVTSSSVTGFHDLLLNLASLPQIDQGMLDKFKGQVESESESD